ncbi:GNAT family N-acetyltransferase [Rhizobium mesoamericanum]|uniref:Putative acetyltransferase n=1 Tax=Rhizobium mesoamericanum STM3625 TaxID=1211777 RepID=K0PYP0_9HYPH|nr:GNAT family N-acetyltransferase [Rhizobium mesoamericanum]CCM79083.1 putative acetyltransferase [Rhizobium mesoamericanum STM3625]
MPEQRIEIRPFGPQHLDAAVCLSREAGWPHRLEDWNVALDLSEGVVAIAADDEVVGTTLLTPYETDCATINMVIVAERMRGRGLGRRLMEAAFALAQNRPLRLIATADGLPLYERLGFRQIGTIVQHQGHVTATQKPENTEAATKADIPAIAALDREAFGADRSTLITRFADLGEFAVIRRSGNVVAFACLRSFGRGEVVGPVVAPDIEDAKSLLSHFMCRKAGAFLRIDTSTETGLGPWLASHSLPHVSGGIAMANPIIRHTNSKTVTTFALANQALG